MIHDQTLLGHVMGDVAALGEAIHNQKLESAAREACRALVATNCDPGEAIVNDIAPQLLTVCRIVLRECKDGKRNG